MIKTTGLLPLPEDKHDIDLGKITLLPSLEQLPEQFSIGHGPIHHQEKDGNDDFCTAYGTVGMSYLMDNMEGSPEWVFAASKEISGDNEGFGQNMRTAFKTWVKYGSPLKAEVEVPEKSKRRYLSNYDSSLIGDVLKKKTYVTCKGQYDGYDNIRASLWKFKEEKRAAGIGLVFSWSLHKVYLEKPQDNGFGHFMYATGWKNGYLECINSYGKEAGDNGIHYVSREVINYFVDKYGAMMLIDMPIGEARELQGRYNWHHANWFSKVVIYFQRLCN